MKKLLLVLLVSCMAFASHAQDFAGRISGPVTHTNAVSDTIPVTINGNRNIVTFKYDWTKTSGTVVGTINLQVKLSNVSTEQWATLRTDTLTDATGNVKFTYTSNPYLYYRIITETTGTSVTVHNKYLLYRK